MVQGFVLKFLAFRLLWVRYCWGSKFKVDLLREEKEFRVQSVGSASRRKGRSKIYDLGFMVEGL